MKMWKPFIALCAVLLCLLLLPARAEAATVASGTCGSDLTWTLDDAGTLTISGGGYMTDYSSYTSVPWYKDRLVIEKVVIDDEVASIGNYAFYNCANLREVVAERVHYVTAYEIGDYAFANCTSLTSFAFSHSMYSIGSGAFYRCTALEQIYFPETRPTIASTAFYGVSADVYYPEDYEEWTSAAGSNFGGSLNWIPTVVGTVVVGSCGDDLQWQYTFFDELYITGSGAMYDYTADTVPWRKFLEDEPSYYKYLKIQEGVTKIGAYAFSNLKYLWDFSLPESITAIGDFAFYNSGVAKVVLNDTCKSIGTSAFANSDLWYTNLPDDVTLGESAFSGCEGLTSITIPSGVTRIPANLFSASGLNSVLIPETVEHISASAFADCADLKLIVFEGDAPKMDADAFRGVTADVYYSADNATWSADNHLNYGGTLTWKAAKNDIVVSGTFYDPDSYHDFNWTIDLHGTLLIIGEGYGATHIPDRASYNNWYAYRNIIQSLEIPIPLSSIGYSAFSGLTQLRSFDIAYSGTQMTIGEYAFSGCSSLESAYLSHGFSSGISIGENAFYGCYSLREVAFPSGAHISDYAFGECSSLKDIYISGGDSFYNFSATSNAFAYVNATVKYPVGYTLYSNAGGAYGGTVTWEAVNYGMCGHGIYWDFHTDTGVLTISGSGKPTSFWSGSNTPWCKINAQIKAIVVSEGITALPEYLFEYAENAETVSLPSTLTTIDANAFNDCESLNNMLIPASVKTITRNSYRCGSLTDVYYQGTEEAWALVSADEFASNKTVHFLQLQEGTATCTEAGTESYYIFDDTSVYGQMYDLDMNEITSVKEVPALGHTEVIDAAVAATCTESGMTEGKYCSVCSEVLAAQEVIPALGHKETVASAVAATCTATGLTEGRYCSECKEVYVAQEVIPALGHKEVATAAVAPGCTATGLTEGKQCSVCNEVLVAQEVVPALGHEEAVTAAVAPTCRTTGLTEGKHCAVCEEILVAQTIVPVSDHTFTNNVCTVCGFAKGTCGTKLSWTLDAAGTLTISGSGDMADYAYNTMPWYSLRTSVKALVVEDGVTGIGKYAFYNCSNLTSATIADSVTDIGDSAFYFCRKLSAVQLPDSITNLGASAFANCAQLASVNIPEGITQINNSVFYGCSSLTALAIPEGVTAVGTSAFYNCKGLTSVTFPNSLESIGDSAFYGCTGLTSLEIPAAATEEIVFSLGAAYVTIGKSAFSGCTGLQSATLLTTTDIGASAFSGCSNLARLHISANLTSVGDSAFDGCSALGAVEYFGAENSKAQITVGAGNEPLTAAAWTCSLAVAGEGFCIDYEGVLYVLGLSGEISKVSDYPWYAYRNQITRAVFTELVEGTLPGTLTDCPNLESVSFSDSVRIIYAFSFINCPKLTELYLPASVEYAGVYLSGWILAYLPMTAGCTNLEAIWVDEANPTYSSDSQGVMYSQDGTFLLSVPEGFAGSLTVREGAIVGGVDQQVLYPFMGCGKLTELHIPADAYLSEENLSVFLPYANIGLVLLNEMIDLGYEVVLDTSSLDTNFSAFRVSEGNPELSSDASGVLYNKDKTSLIRAPFLLSGSYIVPNSVTDIRANAFSQCTSLSNVTLPEGLTVLESSVFSGCTELTSFEIPDSVTVISSSAFSDCTGLTSVEIPSGVTRIEDYTFQNCTALTSVTIPLEITSIGSYAFDGCDNLRSVYYTGTQAQKAQMTIYSGNDALNAATWYCVPEIVASGYCGDDLLWFLDDYGLLTISGIGAMDDYTHAAAAPWYSSSASVTEVIIESDVTSIGDFAFASCSGLQKLTLPVSVTTIGESAFSGCAELTLVDYSGNRADKDAITVGAGNEALSDADWNCVRVTVASGSCGKDLTWQLDDYGVLTISGTGAMADLSKYPWSDYSDTITEVLIGEGITHVGAAAFISYPALSAVSLPSSLVSIGDEAFYNCALLTDVSIPANVTQIGVLAFSGTALTSVTIPNGVEQLQSTVFLGCSKLTSVSFGSGVRTIGYGVFLGCSSLTEIVIPEGVASLGDCSFAGCENLAVITLPATLETVSQAAFHNCAALTDVYYGGTKEQKTQITVGSDNEALSDAIWHCTVPELASGNCGAYAKWTLDEEGTLIISGTGAMEDYSYDVHAPWYAYRDSIIAVVVENGITEVGAHALYNCQKLTSATIADSVNTIDQRAFENCFALADLQLSTEITTIGTAAFWNCGALTEVVLPANLTTVAYASFRDTGLTKVTIPDKVATIAGRAFYGCPLTEVNIPVSVKTIGVEAFYDCNDLTDVHYPGTNSQKESISIGTGNDPLTAATWHCVTVIVASGNCGAEGDNVTWTLDDVGTLTISGIGAMADYTGYHENSSWFRACKSVVIEEGVTTIGAYAFDQNESLKSVHIADTVSVIGRYAFNCTSLQSVVIPFGVTTIEQGAFSWSYLQTASIPDSITYIAADAFYVCSLLQYNSYGNCSFLGNENNPYVALISASGSSCVIPESTKVIAGRYYDYDGVSHIAYGGTKAQWDAIGGFSEWRELVCYNATEETMYWVSNCMGTGTVCGVCKQFVGEVGDAVAGHNYVNGYCVDCQKVTAVGDDWCTASFAGINSALSSDYTVYCDYLRLNHDIEESVTFTSDTYLDLNGHLLTGDIFVEEGATLYVFDSATSDYTAENRGKIVGTITGNLARSLNTPYYYGHNYKYLTLEEEPGVWSSHRYFLTVRSVNLAPYWQGTACVNYKTAFRCSEFLKDYVAAYGAQLTGDQTVTVDYLSNGFRLDAATDNAAVTRLSGTLKDTNTLAVNIANAKKAPAVSACITLTDGTVITSAQISRSLKEAVAVANDTPDLNEKQKQSLGQMYVQFADVFRRWTDTDLRTILQYAKDYCGYTEPLNGHSTHCVCGGADSNCATADHAALEGEWSVWDGSSNITQSGNYYLTADITSSYYQKWVGTVNDNNGDNSQIVINLCLNGHSITSAGRVFGFGKNVTVNIMNCCDTEGKLLGNGEGVQAGVILIQNNVTFSMYDNVTIGSVASPSKVTTNGGALDIAGNSKIYMYGGKIVGRTVTGVGGAVNLYSGAQFHMYDGEIAGGTTTSNGGAIAIRSGAQFYMHCGEISGGNAVGGGNVHVSGAGSLFEMDGGLVTGGISKGYHGGNFVVNVDAKLNIFGGIVSDGQALPADGASTSNKDAMDKNGGNIAIVQGSGTTGLPTVTIGGTAQILGGTADRGGNIFLHRGNLIIEGAAQITGGTARNLGYSGGSDNIHVNNSAASGCITVSGSPVVDEIRLEGKQLINVGEMCADAQIGISMGSANSAGVFTANAVDAAVAEAFHSWNGAYIVAQAEDGTLQLVTA